MKKFFFSPIGAFAFAVFAALPVSADISDMQYGSDQDLFWDLDDSTSTELEAGTFSTDAAGQNKSGYLYSINKDLVFSTQGIGTEAQTIYFDQTETTLDGGYGMQGIYFEKGAITLTDDPNDSGSTLDLGFDGISDDSDDGTSTISPTNILLTADQNWNNNSTQDLVVGSTLSGGGSSDPFNTLTFAGTGAGAVRVTGSLNSEVAIDQESTTSTLYLSNTNDTGLRSLVIDGGTVVAANDANGAAPITIKNGGTLTYQNAVSFNNAITITGGGTLNFAGDSDLNWGNQSNTNNNSANNNTNTITANTLTLGSGDDLDTSVGSQHITTLDLVGSGGNASTAYRLIVGIEGQGLGLLDGTSTIMVGSGYTFDFGSGGTVAGTVNMASGSALEARNNVNVTFADLNLPTSGTLTVGNDDTGSNDSFTISTAQNLTDTLTINERGGGVSTFLNGAISGPGGLTFTAPNPNNGSGGGGEGIVYLDGANTYSGSTVLAPIAGDPFVPVVEINGNSTGIGNEIDLEAGTLVLGPNAQLPTGSVISIGNPSGASNGDNISLQIGNGTATSVTVYDVVATSNWNNTNDRAGDKITGNSAGATLTWDVEGAATNDTFQGHIGDGSTAGNNIEIVKTGAGTLTLTGSSGYTGGTIVDAGTLAIFGGENFGADQSSVGASYSNGNFGAPTVTLNNGSTLLDLNNGLGVTVVAGTAGTVTIDGDTLSIAGQINVVNDEGVSGQLVAGSDGGTGLAFIGGDAELELASIPTAGNIYVENSGTRVLMINNNNLLGGTGYSVTVGNGAVLDFGMGGSPVVNLPVVMENGSALEDRGTNATVTDLVAPTGSGTQEFGIGSDDVGGGSITVQNTVVLANNVEIEGVQPDTRNFTSVDFSGGFSGAGNLTFDTAALVNGYITTNKGFIQVSGTSTYQGDTTVNGGILDLTGSNTGVTSAGGGAPNYYVNVTAKSFVDGDNNTHTVGTPGILEVGAGGSLASDANVVVGGSPGFAYFVLGDNSGAVNQTVANISVDQTGGANDNGAILGGSSNISTLTVDVAANTTDTYQGIFGNAHGYDFADNNTSDGNLNNYQQNLAVVFNIGTGGIMELSGFNPGNIAIAGGFVVNGGELLVDGNAGALSTSNVTLNNVDLVIANNQYGNSSTDPHIILGTGTNSINAADGIDNFSGDIQSSGAGSVVNVSGSNFIFTSDSTLSTIGTLNIIGGRVFLDNSNGLNIIAGGTVVNVMNGTLDLANGSTANITNTINFTSGTGLVTRGDGGQTHDTLTNALLPGSGQFTIGSDDEVGQTGSFDLTHDQALTGDLTLHVIGNSYVPVTLSGNISGNGGISEDNGGNNGGNLYLTGANTYSGETSAVDANLYIDGDNSGAGANYFSNFSVITIGHGGSIASNANLLFGNGGGYGEFVLGDANGAVDQTVGALVMESSGTSYVYNGDTLDNTNSVLTVNNSSADTYTGILGNNGTTNGNNLALVKSGAGTLTLTGANTYTGDTTVNGGKLAVNGSIAGGATVNAGGAIGGSGKINGTIGGSGAVSLGDPTILTATAVDPTGGMTFNLEFTLTGEPNYGNAASSGNDVLHLEGTTPFIAALTSANTINFYLNGNGTFDGGIFIDGDTDTLTADLANATENFYVLNNIGGTVSYDGNLYSLVSAVGGTASESTFAATGANFGDGATDGFEEQITVTGAAIPEPSTFALMGLAGLTLLFVRRRLKA